MFKFQVCRQLLDILFYLLVLLLAILCQIHLIYCKQKIFYPHHRTDPCMPASLYLQSLRRVCKDNRQSCERSPDRHIPGIFFMSRSICYDKASAVCGKVTVSNVNGNSLLPFCQQTVQQQRIVQFSVPVSNSAV